MEYATSRRAVLAGIAAAAALPTLAFANDMPFDAWLRGFREEALQKGLKRTTLDQAFAGVAPLPRILELDRSQPEVRL
ncbi:MAG: lytic murein transglycosylase, partial [Rhodospirillales bacterium]